MALSLSGAITTSINASCSLRVTPQKNITGKTQKGVDRSPNKHHTNPVTAKRYSSSSYSYSSSEEFAGNDVLTV